MSELFVFNHILERSHVFPRGSETIYRMDIKKFIANIYDRDGKFIRRVPIRFQEKEILIYIDNCNGGEWQKVTKQFNEAYEHWIIEKFLLDM
jgi:hypothetical protein